MGGNELLAALDPKSHPLQDCPDPSADVASGTRIELTKMADISGTHDFPGLLVAQQQLKVLGVRLAEGYHVVLTPTAPIEPLMPVLPVDPAPSTWPRPHCGRPLDWGEILARGSSHLASATFFLTEGEGKIS